MAMTDQIKKDMYILWEGSIYLITDRKLKTQGRQGGLVIFDAKNVETGQIISQTVKAGYKFETIETEYKELQYLYDDGGFLYFMDTTTFENISFAETLVDDYKQYMKDGEKYLVMFYEGKPLNVRRNKSVNLEVTESVDAVKGNTANAATKIVTTETGFKVQVPLFINKGDIITINTDMGSYVSRVS